jgi:DNA-binding transcriptional ArsR family regulator
MGEYTHSFKEAIVKKLGGPDAKSARELAQAVEVSQSTLSRWLRVGPIVKNGLIDVRGRTGQPAAGSLDSVSSGFQTRSNP